LERAIGIEPISSEWNSKVLPNNYSHQLKKFHQI